MARTKEFDEDAVLLKALQDTLPIITDYGSLFNPFLAELIPGF